jgi:hypothetical protein
MLLTGSAVDVVEEALVTPEGLDAPSLELLGAVMPLGALIMLLRSETAV